MSKKRKNNNYVTEKRINAIAEKEKEKKLQKRKKLFRTVFLPIIAVILAVALVVGLGAAFGWWDYEPVATHHATIEIEDYGTLHLELYGNDAPETVKNFIKLAEEGYYEELYFSRIIEGFIMQGGEGMGTESIKGEFRANGVWNRISHKRGVVSMWRNSGYDSASDEFFIVHQDSPSLNGKYAAFGMVTSGMEIVDKICSEAEPYDDNGSINLYARPRILSVTVHEVH
jgi:peptidyl-prolyl cis-trans isomerase B (cyclophilin B)